MAPVETQGAHMVRDDAGRVVLICWGQDAPGVASEWAARGYHVAPVDLDAIRG